MAHNVQEPDNARFDCLQSLDNPTKFLLVEIYKTASGPPAHKETEHYNAWREGVADMMSEPRQAAKYVPVFPSAGQWGTGAASKVGGSDGDAAELQITHVYVTCKPGTEVGDGERGGKGSAVHVCARNKIFLKSQHILKTLW